MPLQAALAPVFVLVLLAFMLMLATGRSRLGALKAREVRVSEIALGQKAWPARPTQIANAFANQFEMPVLFYALVAIALPLRKMDLVMVLLAWVFVITRYVHAGIFVTTNNVSQRFLAFLSGVLVLLAMWIYFALDVLLAPIRA